MLKIILIVVVVLALALIIAIAMQPSELFVERSTVMAAPPSAIFPEINNFHQWAAWNPWDKIDPAMKRTYSGPDEGVNARYAWEGNNEVGQGAMSIIESKANERVRIKLEFLKPFAATNTTEVILTPEGDKTKVTWNMSGKNSVMGRVMGLFMSMDKMIGDNYEKGLADLKAIAEAKK